jgi:hypothetical protein
MCGYDPLTLTEEQSDFMVKNVKDLVGKYAVKKWMNSLENPSAENLLAKLKDFYHKRFNKTFARKIDIQYARNIIRTAELLQEGVDVQKFCE